MAKLNIEDYIGKKYAIRVNSVEEFDKIKNLLGFKKQQGIFCFNSSVQEYGNCLVAADSDDYCYEEWWKNKGYSILDASDFIEENESINSSKLIDGEIYHMDFDKGHQLYIFRKVENRKNQKISFDITIRYGGTIGLDPTFTKNGHMGVDSAFRRATNEEIQWLLACEKAGKFIPKEEIFKSNEKPKFEVGKWYKVGDSNILNYKKFLRLENNRFYYSEEIYQYTSGIKYYIEEDWIDTDFEFTLLTDLSEIQQYLPENHPDKIIKKKEVSMEEFGIGDWVCAKGTGHTKNNSSFPINEPWQIIKFSDKGDLKDYYVYVDPNSTKIKGRCTDRVDIRKCEPHEIPNNNSTTELISLPKKWCIKTTSDTRDIIYNYIISKGYSSFEYYTEYYTDYYIHYPFCNSSRGSAYTQIQSGYTEITFEQFEKWVLSKEEFPFEVEIISRKDNYWYKIGEKYTIYNSGLKDGKLVYFNNPEHRSYWINADDTKRVIKSKEPCFDKTVNVKSDEVPEYVEVLPGFFIEKEEIVEFKIPHGTLKLTCLSEWERVTNYLKSKGYTQYADYTFKRFGEDWSNLIITEKKEFWCINWIEGKELSHSDIGMTSPEKSKFQIFTGLSQDTTIKGFERGEYYLMGIDPFENSNWIKPAMSPKKTKFNEQEFLNSSFNKELKLSKRSKNKVKQTIKF